MSYRKGRRFEWEVRRLLESKGFLVIRAARSKPVDLVAMKGGEIYLVECKYSSRIRTRDMARLMEAAEKAGARLVLASKKKYQRGINLIDLLRGGAIES